MKYLAVYKLEDGAKGSEYVRIGRYPIRNDGLLGDLVDASPGHMEMLETWQNWHQNEVERRLNNGYYASGVEEE